MWSFQTFDRFLAIASSTAFNCLSNSSLRETGFLAGIVSFIGDAAGLFFEFTESRYNYKNYTNYFARHKTIYILKNKKYTCLPFLAISAASFFCASAIYLGDRRRVPLLILVAGFFSKPPPGPLWGSLLRPFELSVELELWESESESLELDEES